MNTYFSVIDNPKGNNCIRAFVKLWFNDFFNGRDTEYFVVVDSKSAAEYIENDADDFNYCDNVPDLMEALEEGGSVCTTNEVFLEAMDKFKKILEEEDCFTQSIILNDKLPWLEHLSNGEVKIGLAPDFLELFDNFATITVDDYEGSNIKRYCDMQGFTAKLSDIFN